jgi:hypothetical protein
MRLHAACIAGRSVSLGMQFPIPAIGRMEIVGLGANFADYSRCNDCSGYAAPARHSRGGLESTGKLCDRPNGNSVIELIDSTALWRSPSR